MKKCLTIAVLSILTAGFIQADMPNRPARKVIICDLHGVVLNQIWSPAKVIKAATRKRGEEKGCFRSINKEQLKGFAKLIFRKNHISDEAYVKSANKNNNPKLAALITEIVNSRKVNNNVFLRLKTLRSMGYEVIVGSNIGATSYKQLVEDKPEFKRVFSGRAGVVTCNDPENPDVIVQKPSVEYFNALLSANGLVANYDTIIFIDNEKRNIIGAEQAGLTAIHYKNPQQLDTELAKVLPIGPQIGVFAA